MNRQQNEPGLSEKAGPWPARTDLELGGDDIGLPTGIQPEEAPREIHPDPDKAGTGKLGGGKGNRNQAG